jgi:hypothetical protein
VVYADPNQTPSNTNIGIFAAQAHSHGFTMMLRPLLDIGGQTATHWRGSIQPSNLGQWQATYAALLVNYGRVAQANGIDSLVLGSELSDMEVYTTFWHNLVINTRGVYSGKLTYSANWAQPSYPAFGWMLDFIAIDAYYPLPVACGATVTDLLSAWLGPLGRIAGMAAPFHKPVVLTELGTSSQWCSFQKPWVWDNGLPTDQGTQVRYYQAACPATVGTTNGIYWWDYGLDPLSNPMADRSFDIYGKPAEHIVSACFNGTFPH